ncbi:MAG: cell division protein ZapD [Spiribacter sp.]|jgi:cell division protein ZapD|nr:cell division protein ZapD [Spiribacter sp.]MDR9489449.1 cell division protein ZapD [Spiribacter sp.]
MSNNDVSSNLISYEYPLNERMRTFLRLEYLFAQYQFGAAGQTTWHTRAAVSALLDVMSLLSRSDIRSELQKELDRLSQSLSNLQKQPQVDAALLQPVLEECKDLSQRLRSAPTGIPAIVRNSEFLATIEQRAGVLGGTCAFDLAGYHLWLESPVSERQKRLAEWHGAFTLIDAGSAFILRMLRGSADPAAETAQNGTFQATLDHTTPYQLLRVLLEKSRNCYPEISGSKHFCNIRFLEQPQQGERPQQVRDDIPFTLERCVI